jgi:hypothetical protein
MNRSINITILKSLIYGYNFFGILVTLNKGSITTSNMKRSQQPVFFTQQPCWKALPTRTTTTQQIPNHNPKQKHKLKNNRQKARVLFYSTTTTKERKKTIVSQAKGAFQ